MLRVGNPSFERLIGTEISAAEKRATSWYCQTRAGKQQQARGGDRYSSQLAVSGPAGVAVVDEGAETSLLSTNKSPLESTSTSAVGPRTVGVQSGYRDVEAQTEPYSPPLDSPDGTRERFWQRELLSLEQLTHANRGLHPSKKAIDEMIEDRRLEKEYENDRKLRDGYNQARDALRFERNNRRIDKLNSRRIQALERALKDLRREHKAKIDAKLNSIRGQMEHDYGKELLRARTDQTRRLRKAHFTRVRDLASIKSLGDPVGRLGKVIDSVTQPIALGTRPLVHHYGHQHSEMARPFGDVGDTLAPSLNRVTAKKDFDQCASVEEALTMPKPPTDVRSQLRVWLGSDKEKLRAVRVVEELNEPNRLPLLEKCIIGKVDEVEEKELDETGEKAQDDPGRGPKSPRVKLKHPVEHADDLAKVTLTKVIKGRAAEMMMHQGRDQKRHLIEELMHMDAHRNGGERPLVWYCQLWTLSDSHRASVDRITALSYHGEGSQCELGRLSDSSGVQTSAEEIDETDPIPRAVQMEAAFQTMLGRSVGRALDEIAKEKTREVGYNRVAKMATYAEGVRRRREGKEAGHRQAALRLRSYEDSFRNSIGTMVQREADTLVDDALAEGLGECAKRRALQEARATARFVNPVLNAMEENNTDRTLPGPSSEAVRSCSSEDYRGNDTRGVAESIAQSGGSGTSSTEDPSQERPVPR
ncbi:MYCBP AMY-1-associated, testis expressed 1 [Perkinsus olseni]|uniref:Cilia- and flagella-associated protein 91 n=1 Tax=Perkinsus olseni TaxID=32597 RepID=A0A7J6NVR6_PEROL|nr:MYCBP AMY-1-associated, testis expressed 1 [Perkinsus olseni]